MNGHAPAFLAAVLDHGVDQRPDLFQRESATLREQADAISVFVGVDVAFVLRGVENDAGDVIVAVVNRRRV